MKNHHFLSGGTTVAKAIILFVAFLFILVPVAPAFAQDPSTPDAAPKDSSSNLNPAPPTTDPIPVTTDPPANTDPAPVTTDPTVKPVDPNFVEPAAPAISSVSPIAFNIPTQAKASVDQSSGALSYAYPIKMPEGRNGMTPKLSLNYDSRKSTQPDSIAGLGWSLSIPYIQREPIKGTQNLFSSAYFSSSESGNLIATTDTSTTQYATYRPESDSGDYLKYTFNADDSWTVIGKDGLTYFYGVAASSRQDNPIDSTQIYKWMLTKISDTHGNEIQYTYTKDNGQIYPNKIYYTYNITSPAVNTVTFTYTTPTSGYGATTYNSGFAVTTFKYLANISIATTTNGQTGTHTYSLNMTDAPNLKQKLVSSITHTFDNPQPAMTDPFQDTTTYSYSTKTPGWQVGTHSLASIDSYFAANFLDNATGTNYIYPGDFDGNGYLDLLFSYPTGQVANNKLMLNNGTTFVDSTDAWGIPQSGPAFQSYTVADLNGDHLPDLAKKSGGAPYINSGTGFVLDNSGHWDLNTYLTNSNGNCSINGGDLGTYGSPTFLFDINNDGKNDLIRFGSSSQLTVFLNNGNEYTPSTDYSFVIKPGSAGDFDSICGSFSNPPKNYQTMVDVNGDGKLDYVNFYLGTYLNTGSGFSYSSSYSFAAPTVDRSGMVDINGDGLIDYLSFTPNDQITIPDHTTTYLNNGSGFTVVNTGLTSGPWETNDLAYNSHNSWTWGQLTDINADGFPDVLGANNGGTSGKVRAFNDSVSSWVNNSGAGDNWTPVITPFWGVYQDFNNDGVLDFMTPERNWWGNSQPAMIDRMQMGNPGVPNKLSSITTPFGATTNITYGTAGTNLSDTSPAPMSVVKKIAIQNIGQGQPDMVTQYDYSGGAYVTDPATGQKRFAGFQNIKTTESGSDLNPLRISQTYFLQDNGSDQATNEPTDNNISLIGRPYYSITKNPTGTLKKETWNQYGSYTLATEAGAGRMSKFVFPTQTVNKTTDPSGSVGTAENYTFDTTLGEQIQLQNLGFVTVASDGTYTDVPGDTRYEVTSYASNGSGTIVKPATKDVRTSPAVGDTIAHTEEYYDNQKSGTIGSKGDLSMESKWISGNGATVANTSYTYDSYGNILTVTNPRNAVTTYTYEPSQTQIATQTNAANQITSYTYMVTLPVAVVDPNGRTTTYTYTSLGLLLQTTIQNSGGIQRTKQFFDQQSAGVWDISTSTEFVNANKYNITEQSLDGLGRPVRLMTTDLDPVTGYNNGDYLREVRSYDALGRQVTTSAPYGNPGVNFPALFSVTLPTNLITSTTYDTFDRPVSVVNALGTTTNSYAKVETTTTDANNHVKKTSTDAYGNLVQVKEINGENTYVTNYSYDQRNLLTNITDALGNVRNFDYNNAGWMTSSEDLHAVGDSSYGVSSWTYDLNGNKLTEIQPNGTVVTRAYDNLDRVISLDGSNTAGTDYVYTYDACTNGKGHLCSVSGSLPNGVTMQKSYSYGISGAIASETLATLGNSYTTSYLYNLSDQVSKITYPNGTAVRYAFGEWGLPSMVYTTLPTGAETLYANVSYNHILKPTSIAVVNGPVITHNYDVSKLYRESSMSSVYGTANLQSYTYAYDNVNNITQITEPGVVKTYSYDSLNRLTQSAYTHSKGGVETYNYVYDPIGNITSMNGQVYAYSGAGKTNPHAVTSIGASNYTYDDNGNMTTAPNQTFSFNWQNQPTRVAVGKTNVDSYYDENGQRFIYQTPTSTEVQAQSDYIVRGGVPEITISLGGMQVGTVSGMNVYSSITDNLGTPIKEVGGRGSVVESVIYDPFGKVISQVGTINTKKGYTGHQEDVDTGLVYAQARYYNPGIGRFVSQDPVTVMLGDEQFVIDNTGMNLGVLLSDPQNLNSYAYARNNPIINTDPDGMFWAEAWAFTKGAGNSIGSNNALGFGRQTPTNSYYYYGQKAGDVASLIQGSFETAAGIVGTIGGTVGGIATSPTGAGALAGAGVTAAGLAATAHGAGVAGTAMFNLMNGNGYSNQNPNLPVRGENINGAGVSKHAAEQAELRGVTRQQVGNALQKGVKYYDTKNDSFLYVVREKNAGYSVATTTDGKTLKTVQNFIPNLSSNKGTRYIKLK